MTTTRSTRLVSLCLISATMSLGYGSIYTLLADLRDRFGFSGTQLGLIVAAGFFGGFFAQLFLGRFADRGHVALMVRGGITMSILAMLASAVATQFWAFLIARLLLGVGSGMVGPAIRRLVITRDPEHVGENLGRLAAYDVAGFVLGPLIAAVAAEAAGIRAPFWLLAAILAGVLALTLRVDLTAGPVSQERRVIRELLRIPLMRATLAVAIAFYVTVGMFEAIWAVLLRDQGAETWLIGLTLSLFTVPMIFLAPIGGRMAQRRGPMRVVTVSLSIAAACTFAYGFLPGLWLLLAASVVHAIADSFTMPSNQVAAALAGPPEQASSAQGLLGATGLATAGITGLVAGVLYEGVGRLAVTTAATTVMVVFIVVARLIARGDTPVARPVASEAPDV
ncbi:MAG: MFS transporter [Actinobacteria bacterium]|nr:MFS transporter [Actinomycetota bacterium]